MKVSPIRVAAESIGRPRKRLHVGKLADVVHLHADMDEASTVAAGEAERHRRVPRREQRADTVAVERRAGIGGQIDAAEGDQRRDGGVQIECRGAIEIEIELLLVLVLWLQHATAACGGYRTTAEH